jgi:hypothetical protein
VRGVGVVIGLPSEHERRVGFNFYRRKVEVEAGTRYVNLPRKRRVSNQFRRVLMHSIAQVPRFLKRPRSLYANQTVLRNSAFRARRWGEDACGRPGSRYANHYRAPQESIIYNDSKHRNDSQHADGPKTIWAVLIGNEFVTLWWFSFGGGSAGV